MTLSSNQHILNQNISKTILNFSSTDFYSIEFCSLRNELKLNEIFYLEKSNYFELNCEVLYNKISFIREDEVHHI